MVKVEDNSTDAIFRGRIVNGVGVMAQNMTVVVELTLPKHKPLP
jgi:hypothetical protein